MVRRGVRAFVCVGGLLGAAGCPPSSSSSSSSSSANAPAAPAPAANAPAAIAEITSFYRAYVAGVGATPPNEAALAALRKRHTTAAWQARQAGKGEPDDDPILLAQDIGDDWLERLTATPGSDPNSLRLCLADHCLQLRVVQEAGGWKVDDVRR
jgi:hypothetical protein